MNTIPPSPSTPLTPKLPAPTRASKPAEHQLEENANSAAASSSSLATSLINEQIKLENKAAEENLEHMRDQFSRQYQSESSHEQAALESQKTKGYEQIRDLQRAQKMEYNKLRAEGEHELNQLRNYYTRSINDARTTGEKGLHDINATYANQMESEERSNEFQQADIQTQHELQMKQSYDHAQDQLKEAMNSYRKQADSLRESAEQERLRAHEHFQNRAEFAHKEQKEILSRIEDIGSQQLRKIREETSDKLAAYKTRQSDPFYKLLDIQAKFEDKGEYFMLTARIPQHEQDHLSTVIQGDQLVISGYRRNEEKLDLGPGRSRGTASFQSFHESFPLNWPVDAKRMTREFQEDEVIVRIPKKNEYVYKPARNLKPEPTRAEIPHFPGNLPLPHSSSKKPPENHGD